MTRIRLAGDSALLVEVGTGIDISSSERAIGTAAAIREAALPGVRDVVATYCSVAVYFDPLTTDVEAIASMISKASEAPARPIAGRLIEVAVTYGGDGGPDLEEVARWAGLQPASVIERHVSRSYRVYMLGFLPGFAYLGTVDPTIATPRRSTPRLRVPAGSVGIAGEQTGVYPRESPGGWQIIGRTATTMFDANRRPASLCLPGDTVKFVPTREEPDARMPAGGSARPVAPAGTTRAVAVVQPGLMTTVQDLGRWGMQALGVPVAGAMDSVAHRIANARVGNDPEAATLEVTITGPELRFEVDTVVAISGADLGATLDGAMVPPDGAVRGRRGSVLRFGERRGGARAYIAFDGGIDVPMVLGSRATHSVSGLGGVAGRALRAGDRIPLAVGRPEGGPAPRASRPVRPVSRGGARVRVLPGPQDDFFEPSTYELLQRSRFTISPQSNRMGYRLAGPSIPRASREMVSDAAFAGGLQIPPSGEPILLMADRQTTGGYPQIATVVTADLALAGQLAPGDWIEFEVCSRKEALAALREQERAVLAGV